MITLTELAKARRVLLAAKEGRQPRWQDEAAILELANVGALARDENHGWALTEIGHSLLAGSDE